MIIISNSSLFPVAWQSPKKQICYLILCYPYNPQNTLWYALLYTENKIDSMFYSSIILHCRRFSRRVEFRFSVTRLQVFCNCVVGWIAAKFASITLTSIIEKQPFSRYVSFNHFLYDDVPTVTYFQQTFVIS